MPVFEDVSERPEWRPRSSARVNSRVAVTIHWEDGRQRWQGYTLNISRAGCLVVVPQNLDVQQRVHITNLANNQRLEAVVIWRGEERTEGCEMGIKLIVGPETDFWGLEF